MGGAYSRAPEWRDGSFLPAERHHGDGSMMGSHSVPMSASAPRIGPSYAPDGRHGDPYAPASQYRDTYGGGARFPMRGGRGGGGGGMAMPSHHHGGYRGAPAYPDYGGYGGGYGEGYAPDAYRRGPYADAGGRYGGEGGYGMPDRRMPAPSEPEPAWWGANASGGNLPIQESKSNAGYASHAADARDGPARRDMRSSFPPGPSGGVDGLTASLSRLQVNPWEDSYMRKESLNLSLAPAGGTQSAGQGEGDAPLFPPSLPSAGGVWAAPSL